MPLNQTIGYDKKELEGTMIFINSLLEKMDAQITMMEEQGAGLRNNLEWAPEGKDLRLQLEQFKEALNTLGVIRIPCNNAIGLCYDAHLEKLKEKHDVLRCRHLL